MGYVHSMICAWFLLSGIYFRKFCFIWLGVLVRNFGQISWYFMLLSARDLVIKFIGVSGISNP